MIYLKLFWTFFKIGLFTIGGGYAMIPMIQQEVVSQGWATMDELVNFIAIAESTPGAFAVNVATFSGFNGAGVLGAVVATLGLVTPSIIIIIIVAKLFTSFSKNKHVQNILKGVRPVVVGLILSVAISLLLTNLFPNGYDNLEIWNYQPLIIIPICLFLKLKFKKLSPIFIILIAAGLGMLLF